MSLPFVVGTDTDTATVTDLLARGYLTLTHTDTTITGFDLVNNITKSVKMVDIVNAMQVDRNFGGILGVSDKNNSLVRIDTATGKGIVIVIFSSINNNNSTSEIASKLNMESTHVKLSR